MANLGMDRGQRVGEEIGGVYGGHSTFSVEHVSVDWDPNDLFSKEVAVPRTGDDASLIDNAMSPALQALVGLRRLRWGLLLLW